jgi:hypothetical protein
VKARHGVCCSAHAAGSPFNRPNPYHHHNAHPPAACRLLSSLAVHLDLPHLATSLAALLPECAELEAQAGAASLTANLLLLGALTSAGYVLAALAARDLLAAPATFYYSRAAVGAGSVALALQVRTAATSGGGGAPAPAGRAALAPPPPPPPLAVSHSDHMPHNARAAHHPHALARQVWGGCRRRGVVRLLGLLPCPAPLAWLPSLLLSQALLPLTAAAAGASGGALGPLTLQLSGVAAGLLRAYVVTPGAAGLAVEQHQQPAGCRCASNKLRLPTASHPPPPTHTHTQHTHNTPPCRRCVCWRCSVGRAVGGSCGL